MKTMLAPRIAAIPVFLFASMFATGVHADAINGAIYTSTFNHSQINANQYPTKEDVYLNGGPSNAGCNGGKLDDGIYHFQVTDPSGANLLSNGSSIWDRTMQVVDGVIKFNLGDQAKHPNGDVSPCGSLAIRLFPYDDTPNGGGVYKVWITRVSDYMAACGGDIDCGKAGFVPGHTKTDNYKVGQSTPPEPETGSVRAFKFYDSNANGAYDNGIDILLDDWKMTLASLNQSVDSTKYTFGGSTTWSSLLPDDDYTVTEGTPAQGNWVHSATIYVGHDGSPQNPAGPLTVVAGATTDVMFGNYCTIPSNGRTLGFWSNKNGQALIGNDDIGVLVALNLRNADGSHFDPANKGAFRTWLLGGTATNMAYMLSVQMAAMRMNVYNGFVNGNGFYPLAGMTVNQIIAAANTSLGLYGYTTSPHAQRAYQENLKDYLDALNNGDGLLSPTPCAYSFP